MNSGANSDLYEPITSARRNFPHMPVLDFPVLDFPTPNDDRSLEETNSPQFEKNKYKPEPENMFARETETIKEWWIGHVLEVYPEQRYFSAHLRDLNFVESIAEFDYDSVFENDAEVDNYLFKGAEFAFFVMIRHGRGSPETVSRVEFSSPYIWKEEDAEKAELLYYSIFGKDEF